MYGAVFDWHTLEGPFVVKRQGSYWCFYSGGCWTDDSYGLSYAVADSALGPLFEPEGHAPNVLPTVPGRMVGFGHASPAALAQRGRVLRWRSWVAPSSWRPQRPSSMGRGQAGRCSCEATPGWARPSSGSTWPRRPGSAA